MSDSIDRSSSSAGIAAAIGAGARFVADLVADLIERIVNGLKGIAPIALVIGCHSDRSPDTAPAEQAVVSVPEKPPVPEEPAGPKQIGKFNITFYYVVGEEELVARTLERKAAND